MSHAYRWIVAAALMVVAPSSEPAALPATPVVAVPDAAAAADAVAAVRPMEVRIRKLYLVRPDLLQFPNPYDVVC